ncbi:MAG: hypothetical protein ACKO9D_13580, partial [Gammaproteobacteria bacterium]
MRNALTRRASAFVRSRLAVFSAALASLLSLVFLPSVAAAEGSLRIITWADYVPADVAAQFTK